MHQPHSALVGRLALSVMVGGASLLGLLTSPVAADDEPSEPTTTFPAEVLETPVLYGTTRVSGATVTTPGEPTRTLDANQMTAFVQTWLAYSVYNEVPNERPAEGVPVSRLAAQLIDLNGAVDTEFLYATDGTKVWVGAATGAGGEEKWIVAPDPEQTTKAFQGELQPLEDPISPSTTVTSTTTTASPETTSDDAGAGPVAAAGAAAMVAIAAALLVRARRRRPLSPE